MYILVNIKDISFRSSHRSNRTNHRNLFDFLSSTNWLACFILVDEPTGCVLTIEK